MVLDVVGVGLGRTSTLSLKPVLERLGLAPCEHMTNLLADPDRIARWLAAARNKAAGQPIDWAGLFAGYRATIDWPGAFFWRGLVVAYPAARIILTVRGPERWYDSAADTILRLNEPRAADGSPLQLAPEVAARRKFLDPLLEAVMFEGTFRGRAADREFAVAAFVAHNAAVQAEVPADRLLVYEVAQGWEPLCRFLGVPASENEPFPRVNDAATFREQINRFAPAASERSAP